MGKLMRVFMMTLLAVGIVIGGSDMVANAGPAKPVTFAECPMIQADDEPQRWVYSNEFTSVVFKGKLLGFGIHCYGLPDRRNQEVYCGGVKVPKNEIQTEEIIADGTEEYWYQIVIPLKYAKYGMINIPVRGMEGGERFINLPMLNVEEM